MDNSIYLTNLSSTVNEKLSAFYSEINNENTNIFKGDDFYTELDNLRNNKINRNYNEFIISNNKTLINLFLDIDVKKSEIKKDFNEDKELKVVIKNVIEVLEELKDSNQFITSGKIKDELIGITKSTDPDKYSYHIFFKNIYINSDIFSSLKTWITKVKTKSKSILNKFIDINVYRKNPQLRIIFSKKPEAIEKSDYIHIPFNPDILNKDNYKVFTFSLLYPKKDNFIIENLNLDNKNLDDSLIGLHNLDLSNLGEYTYYSKYSLFNSIYSMITKSLRLQSNELEKINEEVRYINCNKIIKFEVDFCYVCKRKHKSLFILQFLPRYFSITKHGNSLSCLSLNSKNGVFFYPSLQGSSIIQYFIDIDYIRKIDKLGTIIFWFKNDWKEIILTGNTRRPNLLIYYISQSNILRPKDLYILDNHTNLIDSIETTIGDKTHELTSDPYILKLKNGFYFFRDKVFKEFSEDLKYIVKLSHINIEYKDYDEVKNDLEYIKNRDFINNIFDTIIFTHKNESNNNVFKSTLSSILYTGHKGVIVFCIGETSSGKSTLKFILKKILSESYIEIPVDVYIVKKTANTPNPWLGQLNGKLFSFASETSKEEKFIVSIIKKLTEREITARKLHSNECIQENHLTQFVDLNFIPTFDKRFDPALLKRYSIIHFDSYFANEDDKNYSIKADGRKTFMRNKDLDDIVSTSDLSLPLLHILMEWFNEYHLNKLTIYTAELIDFNEIEDSEVFIKVMKDNTKQIYSSNLSLMIKSEARFNYKIIKYFNREYICCDSDYFLQMIKIKLEEYISSNQIKCSLSSLYSNFYQYMQDNVIKLNSYVKYVLIQDLNQDPINY